MKMNIEELETADYDILENIKVAFYRLWKMKIVVLLMTLIGFLAFGVIWNNSVRLFGALSFGHLAELIFIR